MMIDIPISQSDLDAEAKRQIASLKKEMLKLRSTLERREDRIKELEELNNSLKSNVQLKDALQVIWDYFRVQETWEER